MQKRISPNPITVIPPTWKEDFSFDKDSFANALDLIKSYNLYHIYFGCTASEGYAFSREQLMEISKFFAEQMKGYEHKAFVGLIGTSLSEMSERVSMLKEIGIKTFLFALPSWGVLRAPTEPRTFINALLSAHRDCEFILYNNIRSVVRIYPAELKLLEKENPNLVAVKQGGHAYVDARFSAVLDEPLNIVEYYLDYAWTYANLYFDPSFMPSTISCSFNRCMDFYKAGVNKDFKTCLEIDKEIQRADHVLSELFPGDRIDGAYDKMWLKMNIPDFPLRLLPPYEAFSDEQFEEYRARMKQVVPNWF